jgi:hypothetical protein
MTRRSDIRIPERGFATRCGHRWITGSFILAGLGCVSSAPALADGTSREQMKGLDEQVQEIKTDVLSIASELNLLEERLLYPSNTQVALFVSLPEGEKFRLDAVHIQIDGQMVAEHIYSFNELDALQKGGVQRIYTGNITTGSHVLDVMVAGKSAGGQDFNRSESFTFSKDVEPKLVDITLNAPDAGGGIQLADR